MYMLTLFCCGDEFRMMTNVVVAGFRDSLCSNTVNQRQLRTHIRNRITLRVIGLSDASLLVDGCIVAARVLVAGLLPHSVPELIANRPLVVGRPGTKMAFYVHSAAARLYRPVFATPHQRRHSVLHPALLKRLFGPSAGLYLVRMCFNFPGEYKKLLA